ncbi:DUF2478 domain-containing protein [Pseudothauera rhizosphaerae]|uniref:DUF2478 domain-containing protein n=1 Tax=Pseudothauera rhizosphaerae TaxID=2565932 RepID=A0A4S4ARV1_9RHOO|nr:DUF2478 domain-containing protein [Pseudothauera rhizosphaerae]THF62583.1 DUF2478 domain-containing protein [Pseudothauera rhizosphaerae]
MKKETAIAALPEPPTVMAIPAAAIVHAHHASVDGLLADFAFGLRKRGWRVCGIVQQHRGEAKEDTVLVDLDHGLSFPLFQKLGAGSTSCSVDPGGVAAASIALRRALDEGADLAIANRFGALEAAGGGFAAEMLALMSEGRPLLTVVADDWLRDWRWFTGGCGSELPASPPALEEWFAGVVGAGEKR